MAASGHATLWRRLGLYGKAIDCLERALPHARPLVSAITSPTRSEGGAD